MFSTSSFFGRPRPLFVGFVPQAVLATSSLTPNRDLSLFFSVCACYFFFRVLSWHGDLFFFFVRVSSSPPLHSRKCSSFNPRTLPEFRNTLKICVLLHSAPQHVFFYSPSVPASSILLDPSTPIPSGCGAQPLPTTQKRFFSSPSPQFFSP